MLVMDFKRKVDQVTMKARYRGKVVDVWQIGKQPEQPSWVRAAFAKHYIVWLDNHVRILMAGIHPSHKANLRVGAVGSLGGGFAGYGMYVLGYPGDYLDITNHRVVSAAQFQKHYEMICHE